MKKAQFGGRVSWGGMVLGAAIALTVLPPVAQAAPARHAPNASVPGTVLSLSDVTSAYGSGFKQSMSQVIKSSEVEKSVKIPGVKSASLKITDFVTGYQNAYTRNLISIKKGKVKINSGVSTVDSAVWAFKSSSTPNTLLQYLLRYFKTQKLPKGFALKMTQANLVGDGCLLETTTFKGSKALPTGGGGLGLFFRHGQFMAAVMVAWYGRAQSLSSVVSLAKKVDSRL